jgi:hypothetical protein
MPYAMPHEDLFLFGVGALIVVLLAVRLSLARRAAKPAEPVPEAASPPKER